VAEQIGIEAVDRRHNMLSIKFHKETRVDPGRLMNVVGKTKGAQFTPAGVLLLPLEGLAAGDVLRFLSERLERLADPAGKPPAMGRPPGPSQLPRRPVK
jgi:transcription-repair coupling factor (superfamily II helicase)